MKAFSWRITATGTLVLIAWLFTGDVSSAMQIGAVEFVLKLLVYYGHERAWQSVFKKRGQTPKLSFAKSISWRLIASLMTLVISSTVIEGDGQAIPKAALGIMAVEFFAKFALYYLHERAWVNMAPMGSIRKWFGKKD